MPAEIRTSHPSACGQPGAESADAAVTPGWGLLLLDADLKLVYCKPGTLELLGVGALSGANVVESLPPAVQALCSFEHQAAASTSPQDFVASNGRQLRASCAPIQVKGHSGLLITIESGVQARDKLLQMDRLASLGTLGAMTAHELKNALVAVKTFVDLLIQKAPDSELNDLVRREIARMDGLLGSVSQMSASHAGGVARVDLNEVLTHAFQLLQPQIRAREARLEQQLARGHIIVQGRSEQLLQAMLNLLMNALDAGGNGGVVTVQTDLVDGVEAPHVSIAVSDTGGGIAPENVERLFQPFFTTKPQGTGLGLYITRRIVQEHGGAISVQSKPERGACFQIRLPLAK